MSSITRTRPPVKPTRHPPRLARLFGEGIFPSHEPRRMPYTAADQAWAAQHFNEDATDYDVLIPGPAPIRGGSPEPDWDAMAWEAAAQARLERGHCL
jgi:hypothetical protein